MLGFSTLSEQPLSTQAAKENELILPLLSNTNTLYTPIVASPVGLPYLENNNTFYVHTLAHNAELPLITNTSQLYEPRVAFLLKPPLLNNVNTFYALEANHYITLAFIPSSSVLYPPQSELTPQELIVPLLSNKNQLYAPYQAKRQKLVYTGVSYILE